MDNINIDPETLEIQPPDYTTEIVEILKSNLTPKALKDKIMDYHENDIAAAMEPLPRYRRYTPKRMYNYTALVQSSNRFQSAPQRTYRIL